MKMEESEEFRRAVVRHWGEAEEVLKICLVELKDRIARESSRLGFRVAAGTDNHIACAGKIGVAIGLSKDPAEFLHRFEGINLSVYAL